MELTIDKIHRVLGSLLGPDAISLQNYVHRVEKLPAQQGVVIGADGVLYYSPEWFANHINTPEKLRHVLAFELFKKLLGADRRGNDWIASVATAAVINAFLFQQYGYAELPRALYSAVQLPECLMRPHARGFHSRLKRIYSGIWHREERFTSIPNVERALRIIFSDTSLIPQEVDPNELNIPSYLHGMSTNDIDIQHVYGDIFPDNLLDQVAQGVCNTAGFGATMYDGVVKKIKTRKTLERKVLERFCEDQIKQKFNKFIADTSVDSTPIPEKLTRQNIISIARGQIPMSFDVEFDIEDSKGGLAVYMDVSGSFNSFIPYARGLLENFQDCIDAIYQFSNGIHKTDFRELSRKDIKVDTTGGTDFDCVFRHAIENKFGKIIIITDGYADVNDNELLACVSGHVKQALFVLMSAPPGSGKPIDSTYAATFMANTRIGKLYPNAIDISELFKDYGKSL